MQTGAKSSATAALDALAPSHKALSPKQAAAASARAQLDRLRLLRLRLGDELVSPFDAVSEALKTLPQVAGLAWLGFGPNKAWLRGLSKATRPDLAEDFKLPLLATVQQPRLGEERGAEILKDIAVLSESGQLDSARVDRIADAACADKARFHTLRCLCARSIVPLRALIMLIRPPASRTSETKSTLPPSWSICGARTSCSRTARRRL